MNSDISELRVLLVDDSAEAISLVRSMRMELGINQVFTAKDGRQALDFLGDCDDLIDAVLCDWRMPKLSGLDVLRRLRTVDPELPFIMITGSADADSVAKAKDSGVTAYIRKPFSAGQLEKKLNVVARLNNLAAIRNQALS